MYNYIITSFNLKIFVYYDIIYPAVPFYAIHSSVRWHTIGCILHVDSEVSSVGFWHKWHQSYCYGLNCNVLANWQEHAHSLDKRIFLSGNSSGWPKVQIYFVMVDCTFHIYVCRSNSRTLADHGGTHKAFILMS